MKRIYFLGLAALAGWLLPACDSGDIYPEDIEKNDKTVTGEFTVTGLRALPVKNQFVLAVYHEGNEVPVITQAIVPPEAGKPFEVTLLYVPDDATKVTVSILGKTWRTIYDYYSGDVPEGKAVTIPAQAIDLLKYARIQQQVFSQCVQCHGGSNFAAAGLFLTEEKSYAALVGRPAVHSGKSLVEPGVASSSALIDVLEGTLDVGTDHTTISSLKEEDIDLLKAWIDEGAGNH